MAPGVGGEEEGDLLEGGERRAGKGIVGEQGGEGGEDGEAEGGMVGAGEEHVDFIAEGVGGATGAGPGGVRDMAASGEGQKAVGGEVAALAAQPEERDGRVGGKEPEVEGGLVEVGPLEVGRVQVEVGIAAGEGGVGGGGVEESPPPEVGDDRAQGAGIRALNVGGFASASETGGQGKGAPLMGLKEGGVGALDGGFKGGGGGGVRGAEAEKAGGEGGGGQVVEAAVKAGEGNGGLQAEGGGEPRSTQR